MKITNIYKYVIIRWPRYDIRYTESPLIFYDEIVDDEKIDSKYHKSILNLLFDNGSLLKNL